MTHTLIVLWSGFAIGVIYGAIGQRIEFCLAGGIREWRCDNNTRRAAAYLAAMAVALIGTQAVAVFGLVDLRVSIYLQPGFSWLLVPVGGFIFGYGMILAGGCGSRAIVLVVDGNLRSLLVLLCLGVSAHATLTGLIAPLRIAVAEPTTVIPPLASPSVPGMLEAAGLGAAISRALPALVIAAGLIAFAVTRLRLLRTPRDAVGAVIIGCLVPVGWVVTGHFGADDFDPVAVESLTFVAPVGDTIQYLMLATGVPLRFGVAVVGGVLVGSGLASRITGDFEIRGFDSNRHVMRVAAGGALMGFGGALALGCTVGQGLTGFSTLSLPSFLAVAGIWLGGYAAVRK